MLLNNLTKKSNDEFNDMFYTWKFSDLYAELLKSLFSAILKSVSLNKLKMIWIKWENLLMFRC